MKSEAGFQNRLPTRTNGFTRIELMVVLATLVALAGLLVALTVKSRAAARQEVCARNMNEIVSAFTQWAISNHKEAFPHRVPFSEGGLSSTKDFNENRAWPAWASKVQELWFHYGWISNELRTPRILVCPADNTPGIHAAKDFSARPDGGYFHTNQQQNSVSMVLATDGIGVQKPDSPYALQNVMLFDRNLRTNGMSGCSAFGGMGRIVAKIFPTYPSANTSWLEGIHGLGRGNVAKMDGSVEKTTDIGLRELLQAGGDSAGETENGHFLFPKR